MSKIKTLFDNEINLEKFPEETPLNKLYVHVSSGDIYELILITNEYAIHSSYITTAVYKDTKTNKYYSRPLWLFKKNFSLL